MVDAELALGEHRRLAPELEALVAEEPLRERRWGQLIRALYGSGRQADALRAFQRARDVLIEQSASSRAPSCASLEAAVLAQDEALLGAARADRLRGPIGDGFRRRGNVRHPVGPCIGRDAELEQPGRPRRAAPAGDARPVRAASARRVWPWSVASRCRTTCPTASGGSSSPRPGARPTCSRRSSVRSAWTPAARPTRTPRSAAVAAVLGDRAAVLVLDNCEHLLGVVAPVVDELLGRCGRLRVVATSREGLGIAAEVLFTVGPLAPDGGG